MSNNDEIMARLARIEEKLEAVSRVESQLEDFARSWESLSDFGQDVTRLMDPAVRKLTDELVEVESGFQLEDLLAFLKKLLPSLRYLVWSLEQLENLVDWWEDMEPLLKIAVPNLIDYLNDLEQKGIFRINRAVLEMYGKIATRYDADDIAAMGDGFVRMHGMVRKLSNPELIQFLEKLIDVPLAARLEESKPVGPFGMLFKMRSPECREGLGVLVELTRALGQLKAIPGPEAAG